MQDKYELQIDVGGDWPKCRPGDFTRVNDAGGIGASVQVYDKKLKPIFYQNAKYLASGAGVGQGPDARLLRWRYQHVGI